METEINTKKDKTNNFIKVNSDLFTFLKEGDLVEGVIIEKSPREIIVDLGKYGTGIVYRGEIMNARGVIRNTEEGDTIQAKVLEVDNDDGFIELSLSEAEKKKSWIKLSKLKDKEEVFEAEVKSANKGGLIFSVHGIKAFLPASQLTAENYPNVEGGDKDRIEEELEDLVGKSLELKIIDANPKKNKLIVSEKAAMHESTKELVKNYEEGEVITGIVSGLADFGVFVKFKDNQDVEGLIHISELSHKVVDDPSEMVSEGDEVEAKITEIKDGKISLSLKAMEDDPWDEMINEIEAGQEIDGTVYSFNPYGATVNLEGGLQGQVHVTEFGGVDEMKESIEEGEKYTFKVKELKDEEKRINLSYEQE